MGPANETKKKHVPTVPDFIDDAFIKTLSKEKQAYWKNRKVGKSGMPDLKPKPKVLSTPQDIQIGFDNDGKMVYKTRALRRRRLPSDNEHTKKQLVPKRKR